MPANFDDQHEHHANYDSYTTVPNILGGSQDFNSQMLDQNLKVPGMVVQDDLDVWTALAAHLPNDESQTVVSAFFIDSTGIILPVGQPFSPDGDLASTFEFENTLQFLGFLVWQRTTLPFFTDEANLFRSLLTQARISLAGLVQKPPLPWMIPVYCDSSDIASLRETLSAQSVQQTYISAGRNFESAARVYTLSTDDTYFQPWTLGSRSILYPSNDPVLAFPSNHPTPFEAPRFPDSHLLPAPLDNSSPPNASSSTINPALLSTPLQLLPPPPPLPPMPESLQSALTLKHLRTLFPPLLPRVLWAKSFYRAYTLIRQPYALRAQRLSLAEEAHTFAVSREKTLVVVDNPPEHHAIITLITCEHSTFRTNSIDRAKEIVNKEFPAKGPEAVTTQRIASLLQILCVAENFSDTSLDDIADNIFALRTGTDLHVSHPFAHTMVLDLLLLLFRQTIKHCNITVCEMLKNEFSNGEPLGVKTIVYALSLLTDGIVNSFRQSLTQMPVEQLKFLGKLSPTILNKDKDVDSLKFDFLLVLWERLEDSDKWGEKMRETKRHYADVIFNRS